MTPDHATGEQLALLAMDAEVPRDIADHVAECQQCARDLSIVRSLLSSEGIDSQGDTQHDDAPDDSDLPAEVQTAMAETADGRDDDRQESAQPTDAVADSGGSGTETDGHEQRFNPLVAAIVIVAGVALIALVILVR